MFKRKFAYTALVVAILAPLILYVYALRDDLADLRSEADGLSRSNQKLVRHILDNRALGGDGNNGNQIIELRDFVYRKTIVGSGDFNYQHPIDHFLSLDRGESKMLCGGMSQTYVWLLGQYGIPSRTVQLATKKFVEGLRSNDTHVSVEVFDANLGKWIISDPTFNASFKCDGVGPLLDFGELYQCNARGGSISPVENGHTYYKGRRVNEYYLPYSDLLFGIKASGVGLIREPVELPSKGWLENALSLYPANN